MSGAALRLQHGRAAILRQAVDSQDSVRDLRGHLAGPHVQVATNEAHGLVGPCTLLCACTLRSALAAECQVDSPLETSRACCFNRGSCDRQGAPSKLDNLRLKA